MILETKDSVHSFEYIYGCSLSELPVNKYERMVMHNHQLKFASDLLIKLVAPPYEQQDHARIKAVSKAIKYNELMIEQLRKE